MPTGDHFCGQNIALKEVLIFVKVTLICFNFNDHFLDVRLHGLKLKWGQNVALKEVPLFVKVTLISFNFNDHSLAVK